MICVVQDIPSYSPVLNVEDSDGSLVQGDLIRKIPLPGRDTSVGLSDIQMSGMNALGGTDTRYLSLVGR